MGIQDRNYMRARALEPDVRSVERTARRNRPPGRNPTLQAVAIDEKGRLLITTELGPAPPERIPPRKEAAARIRRDPLPPRPTLAAHAARPGGEEESGRIRASPRAVHPY